MGVSLCDANPSSLPAVACGCHKVSLSMIDLHDAKAAVFVKAGAGTVP